MGIKFASIGTAQLYDEMNLFPLIGTMNGGIRLNSNISMAVGAKVEFDSLRLNTATPVSNRLFTDSINSIDPRIAVVVFTNGVTAYLGGTQTVQWNSGISTVVQNIVLTAMTITSQLGALFMQGNSTNFSRSFSTSVRVKDSTGSVIWKWLDQVSDYKTTPPNASIVGTLDWYKDAGGGNEILNYLTPALAVSAITASNPTEPVTIYILDRSTDVSAIPATINGQVVTIDYSFAGKKNGLINFGFGFNL